MTKKNLYIQYTARSLIIISAVLMLLASFSYVSLKNITPVNAHPVCCCNEASCCGPTRSCGVGGCACQSNKETPITIQHITDEFIQHREWLIKIFWEAHVLPALMLMTEQISAISMTQMLAIGALFDAKHQLETQRLLQELQAQAHKDYQPSTGMCQFGTTTRSLAASSQNAEFTKIALSARTTQRQLLNGDVVSSGGPRDDARSRLAQFKAVYCNPNEMSGGLKVLCGDGGEKSRYDKDVNFTQTIALPKTLEIDFSKDKITADEEDALALSANLYGSTILPYIPQDKMATDGKLVDEGAILYMKMRSLIAKRSVAETAYAAQTAAKAQGEKEVQPYLTAILTEMGIKEEEIKEMLGERPSYYAQMDVLTKKLYQTPKFYTDLYDKPTNIDRKKASMQAIGLMQRRDTYRSQLRSEAIAAVWLDAALKETEEQYSNESQNLTGNSRILELPGLQ